MQSQSSTGSHSATPAARLVVSTLLALVAALTLVGGVPTPAAAVETTSPTVSRLDRIRAMDPEVYERRVQKWINVRRERHGLKPVRMHRCADRIAERWGRYLSVNLEFFHQSLDPFFSRCSARYAGETLARGAITPRHMVRLWMESPGHRRILLSPKPSHLGVGAYQDIRGDWLVAADFVRL